MEPTTYYVAAPELPSGLLVIGVVKPGENHSRVWHNALRAAR